MISIVLKILAYMLVKNGCIEIFIKPVSFLAPIKRLDPNAFKHLGRAIFTYKSYLRRVWMSGQDSIA